MKKKPGKLWFKFLLFGLKWEVRFAPANTKALDYGNTFGYCEYNERLIVISDALTLEQQRTTFAHELQHAIEEYADVDYERKVDAGFADQCTDNVARGWIYIIRHCPNIVKFLRAEHGTRKI